jgi:hypothetical protein
MGHRASKRLDSNLNWVALYLTILLLPLEELIDLLWAAAPSVSPGPVFAVECAAIMFMACRQTRRAGGVSLGISIAVAWFVLSGTAMAAIIAERGQVLETLLAFLKAAPPLLMVAVLAGSLIRISARYDRIFALIGIATVPLLFVLVWLDMMTIGVERLSIVYDPVIYNFDSILHLTGVSHLAAFLFRNPLICNIVDFNYEWLMLWMVAAGISEFFYKPANKSFTFLANLVLGLSGMVLYILMPAIGPAPFFAGLFPDHLPAAWRIAAHAVATSVSAFRNTMPSLHAGSAILIYLATRRSPSWHRLAGVLIVLSTLISTLGLGEHYAVDWIAALPVVLFARGASAVWLPVFMPARRNAILLGLMLTALWVLAVRLPQSLEFPWTIEVLAGLSIFLPVRLEWLLARAEDDEAGEAARGQRQSNPVTLAGGLQPGGSAV